jgi:Acetyl-CoA acetyltransferase
MTDPTIIAGLARTPMGGMQGELSDASAPDLGATAIKGALEKSGIDLEEINETIMGCVLQAGIGPSPRKTGLH